jgi:hypothetical protein
LGEHCSNGRAFALNSNPCTAKRKKKKKKKKKNQKEKEKASMSSKVVKADTESSMTITTKKNQHGR